MLNTMKQDVPGGTLVAEWRKPEISIPIPGWENAEVSYHECSITYHMNPIKCIRITGITKDGSNEMWSKLIYDKTLGESNMSQFLKRVDIMLKEKGLSNEYWILYKTLTDEELEEYHPLKIIWDDLIN